LRELSVLGRVQLAALLIGSIITVVLAGISTDFRGGIFVCAVAYLGGFIIAVAYTIVHENDYAFAALAFLILMQNVCLTLGAVWEHALVPNPPDERRHVPAATTATVVTLGSADHFHTHHLAPLLTAPPPLASGDSTPKAEDADAVQNVTTRAPEVRSAGTADLPPVAIATLVFSWTLLVALTAMQAGLRRTWGWHAYSLQIAEAATMRVYNLILQFEAVLMLDVCQLVPCSVALLLRYEVGPTGSAHKQTPFSPTAYGGAGPPSWLTPALYTSGAGITLLLAVPLAHAAKREHWRRFVWLAAGVTLATGCNLYSIVDVAIRVSPPVPSDCVLLLLLSVSLLARTLVLVALARVVVGGVFGSGIGGRFLAHAERRRGGGVLGTLVGDHPDGIQNTRFGTSVFIPGGDAQQHQPLLGKLHQERNRGRITRQSRSAHSMRSAADDALSVSSSARRARRRGDGQRTLLHPGASREEEDSSSSNGAEEEDDSGSWMSPSHPNFAQAQRSRSARSRRSQSNTRPRTRRSKTAPAASAARPGAGGSDASSSSSSRGTTTTSDSQDSDGSVMAVHQPIAAGGDAQRQNPSTLTLGGPAMTSGSSMGPTPRGSFFTTPARVNGATTGGSSAVAVPSTLGPRIVTARAVVARHSSIMTARPDGSAGTSLPPVPPMSQQQQQQRFGFGFGGGAAAQSSYLQNDAQSSHGLHSPGVTPLP
jgi:hypothetical protein